MQAELWPPMNARPLGMFGDGRLLSYLVKFHHAAFNYDAGSDKPSANPRALDDCDTRALWP